MIFDVWTSPESLTGTTVAIVAAVASHASQFLETQYSRQTLSWGSNGQ